MSYGGSWDAYFNWTGSEFLRLCWYNLIGDTLAAQKVAYQRHLRMGDTSYAPPETPEPAPPEEVPAFSSVPFFGMGITPVGDADVDD